MTTHRLIKFELSGPWPMVSAGVLVFILFVVAIALVHGDSQPVLTHDQAVAAIQTMAQAYQKDHPEATQEEAELYVSAERVVALSYILGTAPTADYPQLGKVLVGSDLYLTWSPSYLEVKLPPRLPGYAPPLDYKIPLQDDVTKGFVPPPTLPWWVWPTIVLSLLGGFTVGFVVH